MMNQYRKYSAVDDFDEINVRGTEASAAVAHEEHHDHFNSKWNECPGS